MDDKYIGEQVDPDDPKDNTPVDVAKEAALIHRHALRAAQRLIALGIKDEELTEHILTAASHAGKLRRWTPSDTPMPGFMQEWEKE